ncbi:MAG: hypothetical protein RMK50_07185 [Nitrososphaerota archaeon]|nr:hypothetical protein [Candidatus Bathyarchaeota archaeon]MDW8194582.1 hypothetical protein [Nitrososphaerota archaeon]
MTRKNSFGNAGDDGHYGSFVSVLTCRFRGIAASLTKCRMIVEERMNCNR